MLLIVLLVASSFCPHEDNLDKKNYVAFVADLSQHQVSMHWKTKDGQLLGSLKKLSSHFQAMNQPILFAMNGGMYQVDRQPVGLYIEKHRTLAPLNTSKGEGNFFLEPNGVFYLTKNASAHVCSTTEFKADSTIAFATQSGPMLVVHGAIHPKFNANSKNTAIRNGVGIMPDGRILMALSKSEVNLHTFASYFLRNGCQNALYLDGNVSRAYCPEQNWKQLDGEFGVMIAVTK